MILKDKFFVMRGINFASYYLFKMKRHSRQQFLIEQLEPRLLLSADLQPLPFDGGLAGHDSLIDYAVIEDSLLPDALVLRHADNVEEQRHEIVFINSNVPDYQQLVDDVLAQNSAERHFEVFVLENSSDGIKQISDTLARYQDIDAVHVISHGTDGAVRMGSTWLTQDTIDVYADLIEEWRDALSAEADLLFYGCDLAAGESGRSLIDSLTLLTGADVAGSDDVTGHVLLGGDWVLEHSAGSVESSVVFSEELQQTWTSLLPVVTFQEGNNGYAGTQDTWIENGSPTLQHGNDNLIILKNAGEQKQGLIRFDSIFGNGPGQIPYGSTINSAELIMNLSGTSPGNAEIYRMLTDGYWDESSTWDSMSSGIQTDGSEASLLPDASVSVASSGSKTFTGINVTATLQAWSDGDDNYGWAILTTGGDDSEFVTSDDGAMLNRPILTVDFTPPASNTRPILNGIDVPLTLTPMAVNAPNPAGLGPVGDLVSDIVDLQQIPGGHDNVDDPDAGAVTGIAITQTNTTNGRLWYSIDNGNNWTLIPSSGPGSVNPNNALLLAADANTRVYYQANLGFTGYISNAFNFRAWDQTAGSNGTYTDTSNPPPPFDTTFSSGQKNIALQVTVDGSNAAPTAVNHNFNEVYAVDTVHDLVDIIVSDIDSGKVGVTMTLSDVNAGSLSTPTFGSGQDMIQSSFVNGVWNVVGDINGVNDILSNVTFTPSPGYSATFFINVSISDGIAGPLTSQKMMSTVPAGNNPPTAISLDNTTVPENALGAVVGNLTTTDPDVGDTHTYTVDDVRFEVVADQLKLKAVESLDFETEPSVNVTVTSTDGGGLNTNQLFAITVTNVNESPTGISLDNTTVPENAPGAVVGNLTTTDPDVGDTHTYTVDDIRFEVVAGQLKLKAVESLDFETEPSVNVTVTSTDGGGLNTNQLFAITVTNVNESPTGISLDNTTVPENAPGAVVGNLTTTDPDAGDTHTYTVDDIRFEVIAGELKLKAGQSLDFETEPSVNVTVTSTDGGGLNTNQLFAITVTNANDLPTVANPIPNQNETEGIPFVFTFAANTFDDPDLDPLTYTATLAGGVPLPVWLSFDPLTRTFSGTPLNPDVGTITVEVTADDGSSGTVADQFNISVADVANTPPTVANPIPDQNATEGIPFVFTFAANTFDDIDLDPLTYTATLAGGAPLPAWLSFDPASRTFSGTPGNPDVGTITVEVTADDGNGGTIADQFDISVSNENDPPTGIVLDNNTVVENAVGAVIGNLITTDPDTGDSHTYSVDDVRFEVIGNQLKLKPGQSLDFETEPSVDVTITSTDSGLSSINQVFTITVIDSTVLDMFEVQSYSNQDGPSDWTSDWIESNDNNSATSGVIRVNPGGRLRIGGYGVNINNSEISRQANFAGATEITLSYTYQRRLLDNDEPGGKIKVQISSDGTSWTQVKEYNLIGTDATQIEEIIDISSFLTPGGDIYVNFKGQGSDVYSRFFIDDVKIEDSGSSNNPPVITSDGGGGDAFVSVPENTTDVTTVTASDVDGDPLSFSISGGSDAALFALVPIGPNNIKLEFISPPNFESPADADSDNIYEVEVSVFDGTFYDQQLIQVTVTDENEAPTAISLDNSTVPENNPGAVIGNLATSDPDAGDTHSYTVDDVRFEVVGNQLKLKPGQSLDFEIEPFVNVIVTSTDSGNLSTNQAFIITVTDENDNPVANPDTLNTDEDTPLTFDTAADLLANDTDADGDSLSITGFTQPTNGTLVDNADGTYTYTPDPDFFGIDTFTYTISDGNGGIDTGTVTITVSPENDDPVADPDSLNTTEDTPLTFDTAANLLANDSDIDGDPLSITGFTQPVNGSLVDNADGTYTYTPDPGFFGIDTFTYTITDGNGGTATGDVTINVSEAANTNPVANPDSLSATEDTPLTFDTASDLLANDTDVDGDPLTITGFTQPVNGTLVDNADGTFTYTPDPDFFGIDTFTYTISDGKGGTNTGTVTITVSPENDDPVADPDSLSTVEDTPLSIDTADLLANDSDVDGDTISFTGFTQPANGTLVDNGGTLTYTPKSDFFGTDSFMYTISDGKGGKAIGMVSIYVTEVANTDPVANTDSMSTEEDSSTAINLLANDTDADGDPLSITGVTQPANGTLVDNGNGTFTYTPNPGFFGSDGFTYTISDGKGGTATGMVSINISEVVSTTPVTDPEPDPGVTEPPVEEPVIDEPDTAAIADVAPPINEAPVLGDTPEETADALAPTIAANPDSIVSRLGRTVRMNFDAFMDNLSFQNRLESFIPAEVQAVKQAYFYNKLSPRAYEQLRNALDILRKETNEAVKLDKTVVGSAISVSGGLSIGYVIWLIRGGTLISSVLSSLPAWQIADPLPILRQMKEDSEDDESLESIIEDGSKESAEKNRSDKRGKASQKNEEE